MTSHEAEQPPLPPIKSLPPRRIWLKRSRARSTRYLLKRITRRGQLQRRILWLHALDAFHGDDPSAASSDDRQRGSNEPTTRAKSAQTAPWTSMLVLYSACTQRACMAGDVMVLLKASRTGALQFLKLECQELLRQILLWLHGLVSAGLRRRGALLPPPPASASGRSGDRSAAQTGGCRWSVGQIGLSKAAAAPRHDASSFRGGSARATSRASFGRQTEAFEVFEFTTEKSFQSVFRGSLGRRRQSFEKSDRVSTSFFLGLGVNF